MSTYNTNFAPVPPTSSAAQMNLVNGMQSVGAPTSSTSQQYQSQPQPPTQTRSQQQPQQPSQQQQQYAQQQFQQQQQQQQQQQPMQSNLPDKQPTTSQTSGVLPPPPQFNSSNNNISGSSSSVSFANKYMPPSTKAAVAATSQPPPSLQLTQAQAQIATAAAAASASAAAAKLQSLNGPMRPTAMSVQSPVSHLPPHLRPPILNGPSSSQHINGAGGGGSAGASSNSSRTASPALHYNMLPAQQQLTASSTGAQLSNAAAQVSRMPAPTSATLMSMAQSPKAAQPSGLLTSSGGSGGGGMPPPAAAAAAAAHPVNGGGSPFVGQPPVAMGVAQTLTTSALSPLLSSSMQNLSLSAGAQYNHARVPGVNQPVAVANNSNHQGVASATSAMGVNQKAAAAAGVAGYGAMATNRMPNDNQSKDNNNKQMSQIVPPFTSPGARPMMPPRGPMTAGNTLQPLSPSMSSTSTIPTIGAPPIAAASLATNVARKPMYPTNSQLPSVAGHHQQQQLPSYQQQQQQQQLQQSPYASAYQHQTQPQYQQQQQQQHPPSMFNGQSHSGPLQYQSQPTPAQVQSQQASQMSVANQGFSRLWGQDTIDLMQNRHILSPATLPAPKIVLHNQFHESINCNPSIMRCTLAKIPESNSLLQKSRLPLGILIHPFRDINSLPVIQCPNIVRCRLCRTYINPFVYFVDSKMWKCNLCYRVNELPEDFQFDPATKTYGDVTRRPEVRSSTIEFIAPSEYMLRPPQPAIYLFLFDVSIIAQQSGYLEAACAQLNKHLDDMPGDARTQVGFIAYDSYVHFYSMAEGFNQPHELTLLDIDDPFLPRPDGLLVNLKECKELIKDLLQQLPKRFEHTHDPGSALGAALQVAYKLMQPSGGRITVFQTCLPNRGPGALEAREDPNNRSAKDVAHLNPATDFYKRYALECSGYQIAVDLFLMNQQYSDMATISGISKHSGGCVHHFPLYQKTKQPHVESFKHCFKRYLTRKIGFEAVMRIRCTRGLQVHTFHGNFFVRSTDLLSLPNVNPDAGYGMQISYEESLTEVKTICFQAALLYTNSEGERRIRVHTLCLPVTASLPEVMHAADSEAIIGLLSKMAVDRSVTSNMSDARDAFINATVDVFNAFKIAQNLPSGQFGQLIAPRTLALMPLYILSLLKHPAFRVGTSTRLDDRVYAMDCMKTLPLDQLMKFLYPEFYKLDVLFYNLENSNHEQNDDDEDLPEVHRLQLSAEFLDSRSMFLLDCGTQMLIYVGLNVPSNLLESVLGIKSTAELPDYCYGLPNVNSNENDVLRRFILRLNEEKPYPPLVQIIRDTSTAKSQFIEKLVDDRSESSLSYYEFLQHIRTQVK